MKIEFLYKVLQQNYLIGQRADFMFKNVKNMRYLRTVIPVYIIIKSIRVV